MRRRFVGLVALCGLMTLSAGSAMACSFQQQATTDQAQQQTAQATPATPDQQTTTQ